MKAIQPDDYFAAVEARAVSESGYLSRMAGANVSPLTPEQALKASRHNTNTFRRTRGKTCPVCGDPIDSRAQACRTHAKLIIKQEEVMNEHKCDQCGKTFDTEQGLRVHKGRSHSKMARKPKDDHPWKSPFVMQDTAPEQRVDPEPIPDEGSVTLADLARDGIGFHLEVDYRMELIETLCDLAACQLGLMADSDTVAEVGPTIARIKAVARHE